MGQESTRVARIVLPDGTPVWARISGEPDVPAPGRLSYTDTGFTERVEASVESLNSLVTGVARSLAEPLRAVRPDEVSVQFGIELSAKAGKIVSMLADGEAKASISVTLTWNGGPPDLTAPPEAEPATPSGSFPGAEPAAPSATSSPPHAGPGTLPGAPPPPGATTLAGPGSPAAPPARGAPGASRAGASPGVPVRGGPDGGPAGGTA